MNYDIDHYINKFEAIPEEQWCSWFQKMDGQRCALGHCISPVNLGRWHANHATLVEPEAQALYSLSHGMIAMVNNGEDPAYQQPTEKQRVLAFLHDLKSAQDAAGEAWELRELMLTQGTSRGVRL